MSSTDPERGAVGAQASGPSGQRITDPIADLQDTVLDVLEASSQNLLQFFARCTVDQLVEISDNPESTFRTALTKRLSYFEQLKTIYIPTSAQKHSLFDPEQTGDRRSRRCRILTAANLATAIASVLLQGREDIATFEHVLTNFDDVFQGLAPMSRDLLAGAEVQFINSQFSSGIVGEAALVELLGTMLKKYPGTVVAQSLETLLVEKGPPSIKSLSGRFPRKDFVRTFSSELQKSLVGYLDGGPPARTDAGQQEDQPSELDVTQDQNGDDAASFEARARLAALAAMNDTASDDDEGMDIDPIEANEYSPFRNDLNMGPHRDKEARPHSLYEQNGVSMNGTDSLEKQYEQARSAVMERNRVRKPTPPSKRDRRKWSTDEFRALMLGLEQVQGPYWSQILGMYGKKGTVSEVLKDRTQVQLKDKARNLKLFFLKNGEEVPSYLKHVTGDLRSRAPGRARKHDAKERLQASKTMDNLTSDALAALAGAPRASIENSKVSPSSESSPKQLQQRGQSPEALPQDMTLSGFRPLND